VKLRPAHPLLAALAVVMLPIACAAFKPPAPPQSPATSSAQTAQLTAGYAIHQAKCANCHAFVNPAKYDPAELTNKLLPKMARKAGLSPTEQQAVAAYLLAIRKP
jgi:mono/diheme cytochrome c family protein